MVERTRLREPTAGSLKPGHTLSVGNVGNNANVRQTRSIISRAIIHKLNEMDPKSRRTKAAQLVEAIVERGIREGDVNVLRELADRTEGRAVSRHVIAEIEARNQQRERKHTPTIERSMTPAQASRIYLNMLHDVEDEADEDGLRALALDLTNDDESDSYTPQQALPDYSQYAPRRSRREPDEDSDDSEPDNMPRGSAAERAAYEHAQRQQIPRKRLAIDEPLLQRARRKR